MSSDYINHLPLTKWLLNGYEASHSVDFPGGGKINYAHVLLGTHDYLNNSVHPTVQTRALLSDPGLYLTDHGPKHIELVMRRASTLARTYASARSEHSKEKDPAFATLLRPYEVFLLALAIHFHDVGNMYGRAGHEQRILEVMENVGPLGPLPWPERNLIAKIARSHGGTIDGDKDTIRLLATEMDDGDVHYRPQLIAGILRLADELSDEHSRADQYGLLTPAELPPTCLPFQKYAQGLRVSVNLVEGRILLGFHLYTDDLKAPLRKKTGAGGEIEIYLLDEIYSRTLKTYTEMLYCGKYMRELDTQLNELRVEMSIFESVHHVDALYNFSYTVGDLGYPDQPGTATEVLARLAPGFKEVKSGETMAALLQQTSAGK